MCKVAAWDSFAVATSDTDTKTVGPLEIGAHNIMLWKTLSHSDRTTLVLIDNCISIKCWEKVLKELDVFDQMKEDILVHLPNDLSDVWSGRNFEMIVFDLPALKARRNDITPEQMELIGKILASCHTSTMLIGEIKDIADEATKWGLVRDDYNVLEFKEVPPTDNGLTITNPDDSDVEKNDSEIASAPVLSSREIATVQPCLEITSPTFHSSLEVTTAHPLLEIASVSMRSSVFHWIASVPGWIVYVPQCLLQWVIQVLYWSFRTKKEACNGIALLPKDDDNNEPSQRTATLVTTMNGCERMTMKTTSHCCKIYRKLSGIHPVSKTINSRTKA